VNKQDTRSNLSLPHWRWSWDKGLVLLLALAALCMLLATPEMITPFPSQAAWYESAALFPRVTLGLAACAGLVELYKRRSTVEVADSDELDSSNAQMSQALGMLVLFGLYMLAVPWLGYLTSTLAFMLASGIWLGLGLRITLGLGVLFSLTMWWLFVKVLKVYFGHGWWL